MRVRFDKNANPAALKTLLSYMSEREINDILNDERVPPLVKNRVRKMLEQGEIQWKSEEEKEASQSNGT